MKFYIAIIKGAFYVYWDACAAFDAVAEAKGSILDVRPFHVSPTHGLSAGFAP